MRGALVMDKDALIEAMARRFHAYEQGLGAIDSPWESLGDGRRDYYLRGAGVMLPAVVAWVAEWLETYDGPGHSAYPGAVATTWREEMA
jgi:hypothetical protein